MPVNATWGELLVGAYHKRMNGCEVVSYNNRSEERGNQMEADVIAIDNDKWQRQTKCVCLRSGDPYEWETLFWNSRRRLVD